MHNTIDFMKQRLIAQSVELSNANRRLRDEIELRKRTEVKLREMEWNYRSLTDGMDDIVFNLDPEGTVLFVNSAIRKIAGYEPGDLAGRKMTEFIHPDDVRRFRDTLKEARSSDLIKRRKAARGTREGKVVRLLGKDRADVLLEVRCQAIKTPNAIVLNFRGVGREVARIKKIENALLLEDRIKTVCLLAAGIAHDFGNFLASSLGGISLAKLNMEEGSENFSYLCGAEKSTQMARKIAQQLLAFCRGGETAFTRVSIRDLLKDAAHFALSGSKVQCRFSFADDLHDVDIDRVQISQVIYNIVLNARQAMPGGGSLAISAENAFIDERKDIPLERGRYIKVSIADNGIGMPRQVQEKIFDPYYTTRESGSGLGLSLSCSIITSHNGHIMVDSMEGAGTVFTFYLPASIKETAPVSATETVPVLPHSHGTPGDDGTDLPGNNAEVPLVL